jgi:hypothetical protein
LEVVQRKSLKKFFAVASQLDQDLPFVVGSPQPEQETPFDESIDELHRAVVLELHPFGQHADSWFDPLRKASYGQKQLVVLRFDAGVARGIFAKTEKTADLVT